MIKNYIKIVLRNMGKYRAYSLINILGLSIGMTCCILIVIFIRDEISFDRYHEKADRIYRLVNSFDFDTEFNRDYARSSAPFAPTLKKNFPEIEEAVRFFPRRMMVKSENTIYYEDGVFLADASVFSIFTFPLLQGDPESALQEPDTAVISESIFRKYFGDAEGMAKTLNMDGQDFLITGVMRDLPKNSHFSATIFISMKSLEQVPSLQDVFFQNWARHEFYTYLLLREGASAERLQEKLPGFVEKYAAGQLKTLLGSSLSSRLQPLKRIHLYSQLQGEIQPNGDIKYVYIFSVVAAFILLIACINFINLATARSARRAKEVGLRKVVGASRYQLVRQFLSESLLLTFVALLIALVLLMLASPFFNSLAGKDIGVEYLKNPLLLASTALILIFVSIASGIYPALFISRYQPASVLKRAVSIGSQKSVLRKGLVIFQFGISIILIIATTVVLEQLKFLRYKKLGFKKEHVVVVPIRVNSMKRDYEAIKARLKRNPNILGVTVTIGVPGGDTAGDSIELVTREGRKTITLRMIYTDYDYIRTMGMEIVAGRDFSKNFTSDATEAFIINEAAVRVLQLKDPLNTRFEWKEKKGKVIGIVKDFQYQSLKDEINPLIIHIKPEFTFVYAMRIRPEGIPATLAFIENEWRQLDPEHPFEYTFMDETFDALYRSEEKLGQIFSTFSILAIFVASLGLFGLALFMVEQRTKEIGIRKVLGASGQRIFMLLTWEFVILVLLANAFAWPVAYILMQGWLRNFAYRVDIGPRVFFLSAFLALGIAVLTISFLAVKASVSNPIDSLRYE